MGATDGQEWWRPTEGLSRALVPLLALQALVTFALAFVTDGRAYERWHGVVQAVLDGDSSLARDRLHHVNDAISSGQRTLGWVVWVGAGASVLLVIWAWRSAKNARALGRQGARLSPGWTIAAFFIPFASTILIFLVFADLARCSASDAPSGDGWRHSRIPATVKVWLVAKLGGLLAIVATASIVAGNSASSMRPVLFTGIACNALSMLLTIPIVVHVTRGQQLQQEAAPAPTRADIDAARAGYHASLGAPQQIVRGPDGMPVSGWYPDPNGVAHHRYWDGNAWTEHVATNGALALTPVVPVAATRPAVAPDWFPDPAGRHQWRFWGGDDWTPHVSDDGRHTDDPLTAQAPPPDPDVPLPTRPDA